MTTLNRRLADADFAADLRSEETLSAAVRGYVQRVRGATWARCPRCWV